MTENNKTIIIVNHYGAQAKYIGFARYSNLGHNLVKNGYNVYIICDGNIHNSNICMVKGKEKNYIVDEDGLKYIYVKTPQYIGNGFSRVKNLIGFYFSAKRMLKKLPKPIVLIAQTPNPLACVAAIQFGHSRKIPVITDIVDLWPESIVIYNNLNKKNLFVNLMYIGERWIYKNSNALIFSMAGGYDYIIEKGWSKIIPKKKFFHINTGVDVAAFDSAVCEYGFPDENLDNINLFKVVYTGSVRLVNNLKLLCDAGLEIQRQGYSNILIMIHGAGDQVEELQRYCQENQIFNVELYGRIEKQQIPYVLSHSDLCVLCYQNTPILRFGGSMNKMFDYFASGKPIISNAKMGYSIIEKYNCGVELSSNDPIVLADEIIHFYKLPYIVRAEYGKRSRKAAEDFDTKILCQQFLDVMNNVQASHDV